MFKMDSIAPKWDEETMSSWKARIRVIKDSGYLSDCKIYLSSGDNNEHTRQVYHCHRIFLESASPLFHQQLQEDAQRITGEIPEMHFESVEPSTMEKILNFIYLDEVIPISLKEALDIVGFGLKYRILGLIKSLSPRIIKGMREGNVLQIYSFLWAFENESREFVTDILDHAVDLICKNADAMLDDPKFLELSESALLDILKRDELQVSRELKLYLAVKRWGEIKCGKDNLDPAKEDNLRRVVQNLIGQIRFPLMDPEEFTLNVGVNNCILSLEDMVAILLYFTVPIEKRGAIPPGRFKSIPRVYHKMEPKPTPKDLVSREAFQKLALEVNSKLEGVREWYLGQVKKYPPTCQLTQWSASIKKQRQQKLFAVLKLILANMEMPAVVNVIAAWMETMLQKAEQVNNENLHEMHPLVPEPLRPVFDEVCKEIKSCLKM